MPEPFSFKRNYRTVDCEEPGLEGFAIRVRSGISNDEHGALIDAYKEILEYSAEFLGLEPAERVARQEAGDTPQRREWALMAPYIVGWNALGETAEGEEKPLPPPAESGPDVFACVPMDAVSWMWRVVIEGYRATGKANGSPAPSMPASGPQIVRLPEPAGATSRRRANS